MASLQLGNGVYVCLPVCTYQCMCDTMLLRALRQVCTTRRPHESALTPAASCGYRHNQQHSCYQFFAQDQLPFHSRPGRRQVADLQRAGIWPITQAYYLGRQHRASTEKLTSWSQTWFPSYRPGASYHDMSRQIVSDRPNSSSLQVADQICDLDSAIKFGLNLSINH